MSSCPAISVLMPVYNAEKYVAEAIESIIRQTFVDFEFIIINDGSTDGSAEIVRQYAKKDSRIKLLENEKNIKISASLNRGIQVAEAPLIARMDADDNAAPCRLEKQFDYMRKWPHVDVCGTFLEVYDTGEVWTQPTANNSIRAKLLFSNSFFHPTVMMKKKVLLDTRECYSLKLAGVEDYALWVKLAKDTAITFVNMPEVLLRYRKGSQHITHKKYDDLFLLLKEVYKDQLNDLGLLSKKNIQQHLDCIQSDSKITLRQYEKNATWFMNLLEINSNIHIYDQRALMEEVLHLYQVNTRDRQISKDSNNFVFVAKHCKSHFRKLLKIWSI